MSSFSSGVIAYRTLIRSARYLFKHDRYALSQARSQLREEFLRNKNVSDKSELGRTTNELKKNT